MRIGALFCAPSYGFCEPVLVERVEGAFGVDVGCGRLKRASLPPPAQRLDNDHDSDQGNTRKVQGLPLALCAYFVQGYSRVILFDHGLQWLLTLRVTSCYVYQTNTPFVRIAGMVCQVSVWITASSQSSLIPLLFKDV